MTSIEWLVDQLTNVDRPNYTNKRILAISKNSLQEKRVNELVEQAKEMHEQELIDARNDMQKSCIELANKINPHLFEFNKKDGEQYYTSTYGSKGSDETLKENHIVDTNEMVEISDEEIEKRVKEVGAMGEYYKIGYRDAIKWYREQLKQL
jgi:hypothetical protein